MSHVGEMDTSVERAMLYGAKKLGYLEGWYPKKQQVVKQFLFAVMFLYRSRMGAERVFATLCLLMFSQRDRLFNFAVATSFRWHRRYSLESRLKTATSSPNMSTTVSFKINFEG